MCNNYKEQSENADQSGNILSVVRRINKQDDYTKYMFSIIAIVMWLFSKVSTYMELGQIQNWQNNCIISHIKNISNVDTNALSSI